MNKILEFLPKKFLFSLILIVSLVYLANFLLQRYLLAVENSIKQIQTDKEKLINETKVKLETDQSYANFVHFLGLQTLFGQKKSILVDVASLGQLLPKKMKVNSFNFNQDSRLFTLDGLVVEPDTFLRLAKYFNSLTAIENLKRTQSLKDKIFQVHLEGRLKQ